MSLSSVASVSSQLLRNFITRSSSRNLSTTVSRWGPDSREKRAGHVELSDKVDGEQGTFITSGPSFELPDEHLMDRVINGIRFQDIPIVKITCTRNNTKIRLLRGNNELIGRKSAGTEGFKNCRKGTTVAAQAVANRVITMITDNEIDTIRLVFNGLGPGRNPAYKVFEMSKLNIVSLSDRTEAIEPWINRPRKEKRL